MTTANTIGRRVYRRRRRLYMSQRELGLAIGATNATISNWERGKGNAADYLPELAEALDVPVEWLEGKEQ